MDARGDFVDRPLPIALFERLYVRDGTAPLPILLVQGPGGSGRTRLLDYLYSRAKDPLTCARVRVEAPGGPTSVLELLDAIQDELAADAHPQCGPIPFPRYELGVWMREVAAETGAHPDREELRVRLAKLLNRRFRAPGDAAHAAQNILVVILQWLIELLLPAFLVRPSVVRRLLWGRQRAAAFAWYERHQRDVELPSNRHMGDVIRKMCALANTGSPQDAAVIDRLMLSAFLADLRAAYDPATAPSARLRTTNCVVLIDDIDLLPGDRGFRLLELIAEHQAGGTVTALGTDPLLLVATSGRRPDQLGDPAGHSGSVTAYDWPLGGPADAAGAAEQVYAAWRQALYRSRNRGRYPAARVLLPLAIPRFSREETRALAAPHLRGTAEARRIIAEELYQATYGHPLAVRLAAQALTSRRPGAARPAVRRVLDEPPPPAAGDANSADSAADELVRRFLRPARGRLDTRLIAACSLPRTLDVSTLCAVLDLPDDESGRLRATEVWDELAGYAFTEVTPDGRLVFHPLLRDLLVRRLATQDEYGGPLSYTRVHARLADRFDEGTVDRVYHELALGRLHAALRRLAVRCCPDDPVWWEEVRAAARAPSARQSSGWVIAELRSRGLRLRRADDTLAALMEAARALYAPTSNVPWSADLLTDLTTTAAELRAGDSGGAPDSVRSPERLVRPLEGLVGTGDYEEEGLAGEGDTGAIFRQDEDRPFVCPRRASRRGLWRATTAVAVATPLAAYAWMYHAHSVRTCGPATPLAVWTVVADRLVDDGMYVRHAGPGGAGPCIGVTDGDGHVFHATTGAVQRRIAEQNAAVQRTAQATGRPYVTAVVMTSLSDGSVDGGTKVAAGRGELEGIYLEQQRHNQAGHVPMLRVLVANTGADAAYADRVARQVVHAAERDPTIVAVLGLGPGTASTLRAAEILGAAGLPMVATAASADAFQGVSPHFFRVAAPNHRQAAVAARYAKRVLGAATAITVEDPTDAYSRNLAAGFARSFADEDHRIIWPGPLTYDASRPEVTNVLAAQVARACLQHPDLIYYAGRAENADTVLNALASAPCEPSIAVMGGHDLALLAEGPAPPLLPEIRNPFYYTTMAAADTWRTGREPQLFDAYRAYAAQTGAAATRDGPLPSQHAVLGHDAAAVLTGALRRAPDPGKIDRFVVWREIRLTTGSYQVAGAGGIVDFGSQPNGDPVNKAVVLLRLEDYDTVRWIGTCGRLTDEPDAGVPPPRRLPCPP